MLAKLKKTKVAPIDPGFAAQLKLDLIRLVQQRDWQQGVLDKTSAQIETIENTFGDSARNLLDAWGYGQ
jgi:hypothetical protein